MKNRMTKGLAMLLTAAMILGGNGSAVFAETID